MSPRVADHEQRRRQVAEATMRVVAESGMDGVKVAEVAAEAGVSVGLVQHYFRTKDDMLLFAFEYLVAQLAERSMEPMPARPGEGRFGWLREFLPLTGELAVEMRVYLAFCGRAMDSERMSRVLFDSHQLMRQAIRELIVEEQGEGRIAAELDPEVEAVRMWALIDGLGLHAVVDAKELTGEMQLKVLNRHLKELYTGVAPEGGSEQT